MFELRVHNNDYSKRAMHVAVFIVCKRCNAMSALLCWFKAAGMVSSNNG